MYYNQSRSILLIILLISIIRYFTEIGSGISVSSLNITIYTAFITFFLMIATKKDEDESMEGNYLKIYFVFCIGFIIVHFFSYWSFCLGLVSSPVSLGLYSPQIVNESAVLSLCCLVCYAIGYISNNAYQLEYGSVPDNFDVPLNNRLLEYAFMFSLVVFYVFTDKRYFQAGGNYEITNGEGLSLISSLAQFFVMSAQVACGIHRICRMESTSINNYVLSYSIIYYFAVLIYGALVMSSGDRGPLIYMAFGYCAPFFIINRKVFGKRYLILAIVLGSLFMTFLGILRNLDGDITMGKIEATNQRLNENLQEEGAWLFEPTMALSNVVRAYNVVYQFTNNTDIVYGLGFLDSFLGFVPGLRTHIVYPLLGIENNNFVNTAFLSTILLRSDHGMGTTPVGDTYFNFGFVGCLLVFLAFGYICRYLDRLLYFKSGSLFTYVMAFWFLVYSVYIGRATFFAPVTLSIYTWILMKFVLLVSTKKA